MARKSKSLIDIVLENDRQDAAIRAARLRDMHEMGSRRAMQVAGTLTAGAIRNAAGGILPMLMVQPRRRGRR
jgi:hypothetical protein